MPPFRFDAPFYIVCEGDGDAAFIDELLKNRGVPNPDFFVRGERGHTFFETHLNGIQGSSDREKLTRLAIVADSDVDPAVRFGEIRDALNSAGFPVPDAPGEVKSGPPFVGIALLPNAATAGNLETILINAISAIRPDLRQCVDEFAGCINAPGAWDVNKNSKRQLNALIAAYCVDDPACSLAHLWNKQHPVPLESAQFDELVAFLQNVRLAE